MGRNRDEAEDDGWRPFAAGQQFGGRCRAGH
jgi:hypothetical protein